MDDLISRRAAIDALMKLQEEDEKLYGCSIPEGFDGDRAKEALEQLPSVQPEQQWIPCSERLPDMHDEVLVTARGEVSIAWLYVDGKWRSNDMPQPMFRDIIAWMPLPDPWEGENNGI